MTENWQQSLRQHGGMKQRRLCWSRLVKARHMLRNYQERESTEQRCHRWWDGMRGTGPAGLLWSTEIIQTNRLHEQSQSQSDIAVRDIAPLSGITSPAQSSVLVQFQTIIRTYQLNTMGSPQTLDPTGLYQSSVITRIRKTNPGEETLNSSPSPFLDSSEANLSTASMKLDPTGLY